METVHVINSKSTTTSLNVMLVHDYGCSKALILYYIAIIMMFTTENMALHDFTGVLHVVQFGKQ